MTYHVTNLVPNPNTTTKNNERNGLVNSYERKWEMYIAEQIFPGQKTSSVNNCFKRSALHPNHIRYPTWII